MFICKYDDPHVDRPQAEKLKHRTCIMFIHFYLCWTKDAELCVVFEFMHLFIRVSIKTIRKTKPKSFSYVVLLVAAALKERLHTM